MKKTNFFIILSMFSIVIILVGITLLNAQLKRGNIATGPLTQERIRLLPIPEDFRNYFLLQSINDTTTILIGDFVGTEKMLCVIKDESSDNTIDEIIQYYPESRKYTRPASPSTKFFTDLKDMKAKIIEGTIFENTYSNKMKSLDVLKYLISKGRDIYRAGYGYSVKFYDPDRPSTIMSEFYFCKKDGRYDLVFITYYYMIFKTRIAPSVYFSVYCKNSKDPAVAEVVESLYKLISRQKTVSK